MTEEEARARCAAIVAEAMPALDRYVALLLAQNAQQNLIARSTEATIWSRHMLDSLQLARFARDTDRTWIDVGSGAGLPGLVIAALGRWEVTLVEPRRRRAEFLNSVIEQLELPEVVVLADDVREVQERYDIVSARAVAPIDRLFELTRGCSDERTLFVLPRGRLAASDMDLARRRWHGMFHVEQSFTDAEAQIVIADRVRPK